MGKEINLLVLCQNQKEIWVKDKKKTKDIIENLENMIFYILMDLENMDMWNKYDVDGNCC